MSKNNRPALALCNLVHFFAVLCKIIRSKTKQKKEKKDQQRTSKQKTKKNYYIKRDL